ncbi:MAG: hypothetical protein JRC77_07490 [Deltaproteobacteria bacterium]|nr:hypothetical protein [Deltaproteobacteria bacterium]
MGDFSYSIDPESHLTVITISGTVTFELAERMLQTLLADPDFNASNRTLIDAKRLSWESTLVELQEMVGLSEEVQGLFLGGNAIVLPDPLHHDLGDLFITYARMSGVDWTAFGDFEKARSWLSDKVPASPDEDDAENT